MSTISQFISALRKYREPGIFNPWEDYDDENDAESRAPKLRRENLEHYLDERRARARWLLIAEAAGFRGCKFSGIAMTCERQLPETAHPHHRTSHLDIDLSGTDQKLGVLEPTAMIVRRAMIKGKIDPREVILWNTVPWHPHKPEGKLTNRTPKPHEVTAGLPILKLMMKLFPKAELISIGKISQRMLSDHLNLTVPTVRHPANGGATQFTDGVIELMK